MDSPPAGPPPRPTLASVTAEQLAIARQDLAHRGTGYVPPWSQLSDHERKMSTLDARNYLMALRNALDATAPELAEAAAGLVCTCDPFGNMTGPAPDCPVHYVPFLVQAGESQAITSPQPEPNRPHAWSETVGLSINVIACTRCGIVQRRDGENGPCRGPGRVDVRAPELTDVMIRGVRVFRPDERRCADPDRPVRIEIAGVAYADLTADEAGQIAAGLVTSAAGPHMTRRLFVGGPTHGQTQDLDPDQTSCRMKALPPPPHGCRVTYTVAEYHLRRIADPETRAWRWVMVDDELSDEQARQMLADLLIRRWINDSPDQEGAR